MVCRSPALMILSAAALPLAEKIQKNLARDSIIYALAGKIADYPYEFAKFSDFARALYQQNRPIIALCASGIIIRALAPILETSTQQPPVLSVAIDGSHIVPLLGVTSGANRLARQIAGHLNAVAAITTSGELRFGINLLDPPSDLELVNVQDGKKFVSNLLDGATVRLTGESHDWLSHAQLPFASGAALEIHITNKDCEEKGNAKRLVYRWHKKGQKQRGRVTIIGLGPGMRERRTKAADEALREADDILGYGFYVDQAGPFRDDQTLHRSDNGQELARARKALNLAGQGRRAVLVSSGDAGVFGMAAAFFEILEKTTVNHLDVDIAVEPGITAALAASSLFGAPLGGDFAIISLSDNLKPQELIEQRLRLIAQADMAMALYNPISKARPHQIKRVLAILAEERAASTPIGLASDIGRAAERNILTTLDKVQISDITSRTVILVGSSQSRLFHACGRQWFYTPRSYKSYF